MHNLITLLQQNPLALIILSFVLGALIGSFLNVVIHRIPIMLEKQWQSHEDESIQSRYDLAWPASHCPHCKAPIRFFDNIPIFSYVLLGGQCRHCQHAVSARYLIIETSTAIIAAIMAWQYGFSITGLGIFIFICFMLCMSMIDLEHRLLPDMLTLALMWLGLLFNLYDLFSPLKDSVIGAVAGYLCFWLIYQIHHMLTGKQGMGYGDFKLFAAIGAWLGWQALPAVALLASLSGLLYAGIMLLCKNPYKVIPFGPFLAIGGIIMILFGDKLITSYLNWIL